MAGTDTRQLQLQISASAELMIRNLKQADNAVADFQRSTNTRLASIDSRFAALGALKGKLAGLDQNIGLGSLAGAVSGATLIGLAKSGLDYASSLQEVSQQLGVTTKDLQVYRYAATQVGVDQEVMDKGLAKLTVTLGKAKLGAAEPAKAFNALGISMQSVAKQGAGDVLPRIADGLAGIHDPAQRAAVEVALFGKAGQQLDTLLASGSASINEMRDAAVSLGLVLSDKEIADADRTADKLAQVRAQLEANIARTVAQNADAIYSLADAFATLAASAAKVGPLDGFIRIAQKDGAGAALRSFLDVDNQGGADQRLAATPRGYVSLKVKQSNDKLAEYKAARADSAASPSRVRQLAGQALAARRTATAAVQDYRATQAQAARVSADSRKLISAGNGAAPRLSTPSGSKGPTAASLARQADAAAKRDRQDQRRATDQLDRANLDYLSSQADQSNDPEERLKIEQQRIDLARQGRDRDIDEAALDNRYIAANATRLKQLNADTAEIDKQIAVRRRAADADQFEYDRSRAGQDDQIALLEIGARLAVVTRDRHDIERRILTLKQQEEREALERVVNDRTNRYSPQERTLAQESLDRLPATQAGQTADLARQQQGVFANYRDQLTAATDDASEALDGVKVHALQNLEDGLVGLIDGTESVSSAFKKMAASIIADLTRIAIEKAIVSAIGGSFFGLKDGGPVKRLAGGGPVFGVGGPRDDLIPAMLSNGEYVLDAQTTATYRPLIEAMHAGRLPRFADGGAVGARLPALRYGGASAGGTTTVRVQLSDDLHATIDNRAAGVAVEVYRQGAPAIVDAAANHTIARLRQPSL